MAHLERFPISLNRDGVPSPLGRGGPKVRMRGFNLQTHLAKFRPLTYPPFFGATAPGGHPLPKGEESREADAV